MSSALEFAAARVTTSVSADGGLVIESPVPLGGYENHLGEMLRRWAQAVPQRTFLAERRGDGDWWRLDYASAAAQADRISQALLDRGLSPERPVMILSGNSIDHALLALGAMQVGIPVVPVSPAYSLMSEDHGKLKALFNLCRPGLVYTAQGDPFTRALAQLPLDKVELVVTDKGSLDTATTDFAELLETRVTPTVDKAFAAVTPEHIAKVLFTSGSTGMPKGVINTHRMLCANQKSIALIWPFIEQTPPVLIDWLPWNHTFGGNHNFNLVLRNGGTLYIDGGKPLPGLIEQTVTNLREVSPTVYFNVPVGYSMLLPRLEKDDLLRESFFRNLKLIFYAAAALPQDLWRRLEKISLVSRGEKVPMTSSWGSTETAPLATSAHFPLREAGNIGIPVPGVALKVLPSGDKMELRVKGPNVTPGYFRQPDLTEPMFDEEGYYRIGDAGKLVDPDDLAKGILFDGRLAEDFKLTSGSWVAVGALRIEVIAAASPVMQDAVITGADRDWVGLLAWPNLAACRDLAGAAEDLPVEELCVSPAVNRQLLEGLRTYNAKHRGSSTRVERVMLMREPPQIDANEVTDKGYINQRAVLERRKALLDRLYAQTPDSEVLVL
ncbi:MAG: feruloyl-CoA synthase [Acidiferrobacteraceae bacterium]|nr:feruloyl-CoA synthase [Acidiferrobacteraceae bacterium]MDP6399547.1 feruloyl-CoA synthase [Arenicellales bacterium]MDP6552258.1 feruloyl-CoA synthase [Arenicellales bacterium]MDP6790539.1 feruloyl-CoA synthase [Arenicellales bacterium]MDP6917777.1 feruloyl-CoA synthase [Arenicellales bacterium]